MIMCVYMKAAGLKVKVQVKVLKTCSEVSSKYSWMTCEHPAAADILKVNNDSLSRLKSRDIQACLFLAPVSKCHAGEMHLSGPSAYKLTLLGVRMPKP